MDDYLIFKACLTYLRYNYLRTAMKRHLLYRGFLLIFAGMLFLACEKEEPQYYSRYFPLNEGNSWTYKVSGNDSVMTGVLWITSFLKTDHTSGDSWHFEYNGFPSNSIHPGYYIIKNINEACSMGPNEIEPNYRVIFYDCENPEESDICSFFYGNDYKLQYDGSFSYTVEAGSFQSVMKFSYHYFASWEGGSVHINIEEYFAPDVGLIYWMFHYVSSYSSEGHPPTYTDSFLSAELTDYEIHPR